jgi:hypothetical protein
MIPVMLGFVLGVALLASAVCTASALIATFSPYWGLTDGHPRLIERIRSKRSNHKKEKEIIRDE